MNKFPKTPPYTKAQIKVGEHLLNEVRKGVDIDKKIKINLIKS